MKFSIIVPVYNTEKYLKQCIESVILQSYFDWELLLIDDESSDGSREICNAYISKDNRIRMFCKKNEGPLEARKKGIELAQGEYCLFLDSDDYWEKELLLVVNNMISKEKSDVVIFNMKYIYKKNSCDAAELVLEVKNELSGKDMVLKMLQDNRFASIAMKAIKREKLLLVNETLHLNSIYGEDLYQSVALMLTCDKINFIEKKYYCYRQRRSSSVHEKSQNKIKLYFDTSSKIYQLLTRNNMTKECYIKPFIQSLLVYVSECLFNQNNYPLSVTEKKRIMMLQFELSGMRQLLQYRRSSCIKFYHRFRLLLYEKKRFNLLIIIDTILMIIKKMLQLLKQQKLFD